MGAPLRPWSQGEWLWMLRFAQTPDGFGVNAVAAERGVGAGEPVAMKLWRRLLKSQEPSRSQ